MAEIIPLNDVKDNAAESAAETDIITMTEGVLESVSDDILSKTAITVPIAELATLGAGVASLIPALRTVTQRTTIHAQDVYRIVNKGAGDVLKKAKDSTAWAAVKTAEGKSKLAKLQEVGTIVQESQMVMPIDLATMMIAAALFSVEQQLGEIADTTKKILDLIKAEKESEIEANIQILMTILAKYKHSWNNELFVSSNHNEVIRIKTAAQGHINSYKKEITAELKGKKLVVLQASVDAELDELLQKFRYYKMSLYVFAMASFLDVLLSGNYKEDAITDNKNEIEEQASAYRDAFEKCSVYLEALGKIAVEATVVRGAGAAGKALGKLIGSIPVVRQGAVDEFLQDRGARLEETAIGAEQRTLVRFAELSSPGTNVFMEKLDDVIQIYNHTRDICFDDKNIYLIAN